MGTQTRIAQTIRGGGDYVLSLKENWPTTCDRGSDAVQQLQQTCPDLIIHDVVWPKR